MEIDEGEKILTIFEMISILQFIIGNESSSYRFRPNGEPLSTDREQIYQNRVKELETLLYDLRIKNDELHVEYHRLLKQTSGKSDARNTLISTSNARLSDKNVERLKSMVRSLLHATQLLSNDRRELYDQLFTALQGNGLTEADIAKRLGKESEIISVYQEIMGNSSNSSDFLLQSDEHSNLDFHRSSKPDTSLFYESSLKYIGPINLVLYTIFMWFLGIIACLLFKQSFSGTEAFYSEIGIGFGSIY
jgi:hypothetical protein